MKLNFYKVNAAKSCLGRYVTYCLHARTRHHDSSKTQPHAHLLGALQAHNQSYKSAVLEDFTSGVLEDSSCMMVFGLVCLFA